MKRNEDIRLRLAYKHCLKVAREHYENFPVASLLLPAKLRPHVAAVYAFARIADDMADEGTVAAELRLRKLADWREQLDAALADETPGGVHPVFTALADTIRRFAVPVQLFHDLLDAFVQDVSVEEYETFGQVIDYCRRSANPIGRILLALSGALNHRTAPLSDALCTALQLANFWQDVSVDIRKPRVYIPKETLARFDVSPAQLLRNVATSNVRDAIRFEVERTRAFFSQAEPLLRMVPFRLGLQLRATLFGGLRMLDRIASQQYDVLRLRPKLGGGDAAVIFLRMFFSVGKTRAAVCA